MFVFLSGYLTNINIPDIKNFYKKRILKVAIPYIIWSVIYIVVTKNICNALKLMVTAKAAAPLYFIFVYIQLVLITPLISKLINSRFSWICWIISPVTIIVVRYILPVTGIELGFPFPGTIFLPWFIYYYLGLLLGNKKITYKLSMCKSILIYVGAIIVSEIEGFIWYNFDNFDMATTQLRLSSMTVSLSVILIAYLYINSHRNSLSWFEIALKKLGDASFGIYLSHILIIMIINRIYSGFVFPILTALTVAISFVCVIIGKKISGKRFSKYLGL